MALQFNRDDALAKADRFAHEGKLKPAIVQYLRVLDENPRDLTVLNILGDLYVRAGQSSDAADCFARLAGAYAAAGESVKAIAVYKKLLRLDPSNFDVYLTLAELSASLERKSEARHYYKGAVSLDPAGVTSKRHLNILQALCDLEPSDTGLRLDLARNSLAGGFPYDAHEAFVAVGSAFVRTGEIERAFEAFREALELNAISRPSLSALSDLLVSEGRVTEALELAWGAVEKQPRDADLLVILGRIYRRAGMLDDAEQVVARLFELDTSRSEPLVELAAHFASRGDSSRALALVDRCLTVTLPPRRRAAIVSVLKQISDCDVSDARALGRLADVYERAGDRGGEQAALAALVERELAVGADEAATISLGRLLRVAADPEQYRTVFSSIAVSPPARGTETHAAGDSRAARQPDGTSNSPTEAAPTVGTVDGPDAIAEKILVLKDAYQRAGFVEQAARQCLELARHWDRQGDDDRVRDALYDAFLLTPSATSLERKRPRTHGRKTGSGAPLPPSEVLIVRQFDQCLDAEWRRAARSGAPVSLLRIRAYVSPSTDESVAISVSERVAEALAGSLERPSDLFARCGRDDYIALLPDTFAEGAAAVAQKMHDRVRGLEFVPPLPIALSIGAVSAPAKRATSPDSLLRGAERAVTSAHESGGNRTVIGSPL